MAARPSFAILLGFVLSACADFSSGPLPISETQSPELASIKAAFRTDCLDLTAVSNGEEAAARRNRLVTAYMYAVDVAYNAYERQLLDTVRSTDLGASLASLSLSTLAATIHDVDVARGASTANTIVSGSHTALTKDALLNQSLGVLQSQMRASRAAQRTLILQRLSLPYENWNSCLALSDVAAFEQAGTLNAALVAVAQSTARASQDNEAKAAQAIPSVVYSTSPLPVALRAYLRPTDPNAAAHRQTALAALKTLLDDGVIAAAPMTVNARLGLLITGGGTDEERIALARKIAEVEADPTAKKALTDALPSH